MPLGFGQVQLRVLAAFKAGHGGSEGDVSEQWDSLSGLMGLLELPGEMLARTRPDRATWRRAIRSLAERGLVEFQKAPASEGVAYWGRPEVEILQARLTPAGVEFIEKYSHTIDFSQNTQARVQVRGESLEIDDQPATRMTTVLGKRLRLTGVRGPERLLLPHPDSFLVTPHATTFVWPANEAKMGIDMPFVVIAASNIDEIPSIPLVTSLHRIGNFVTAMVRDKEAPLGVFAVSDIWISAVDRAGKVQFILIREPVPAEAGQLSRPAVEIREMPGWIGLMLSHSGLRWVQRAVPVSSGEEEIALCLDAPTTLPEWAESTSR